MCTAIELDGKYFGRTLDFEHSFGEMIIATPRECVTYGEAKNRYGMLGVGVILDKTPMYFDGFNEWGLGAAALNFKGADEHHEMKRGGAKASIPSGNFVGFVLGFCRDTYEVENLLHNIVITRESEVTPLHWIVTDRRRSITVEVIHGKVKVFENPLGVLTNAPDFEFQMTNLVNYRRLSPENGADLLTGGRLDPYSRGMGAIGLPGDFSSASRFVRAVFLKENTRLSAVGDAGELKSEQEEILQISRFFHIIDSLSVPLGCVITESNQPVCTLYSCCCNLEELTYNFVTYGSRQIRSIRLTDALRDGKSTRSFPLYHEENISSLN